MKKLYYLSLVIYFILVSISSFAMEYHFGSFNISVPSSQDDKAGNGWNNRLSIICNLILYNSFDIFGTQEDLPSQINEVNKIFNGVYSSFSKRNLKDSTKGESCAIFYKTDIFKFLDGDTFWLSETPDKKSKGWDASLERVCTWVHLLDKRDNTEIWFFNTHMDHIGKTARKESCNVILQKINKICPKNSNVVLVGDFNQDLNSNLKVFSDSAILKDSREFAKYKWFPTGTFTNFGMEQVSYLRLDHIFVSKTSNVNRYAVLNNFYYNIDNKSLADAGSIKKDDLKNKKIKMHLPSDHYPISVFLEFQNTWKVKNPDKNIKNNSNTIKDKILKKIFK